jgi:toxin FitB
VKYLLDTCVVSELVKKSPDPRVCAWVDACDEESLYLSVLTLGEIQKGIAKVADTHRRTTLQLWLDKDLHARFEHRLLPVSEEVALTWGALCGAAELVGKPIPSIDGLIGATAIAHNLTVATRNETDIGKSGVHTLNPWKT